MKLLVVGLLAGCGRFGFDPITIAIAIDADLSAARPCGRAETAPPTITLSGQTFEYTSFTNASAPISNVMVTAHDVETGDTLVGVTSGSGGDYVLGVMTSGEPRRVALRYATAGYFTTTAIADLALDESTLGGRQPLWSFGDAPIWSNAAMGMVYTAGGVPRATASGTLNIAVRDCAGAVIEDVIVAVEPTPGVLRYQGADGKPSTTLTATEGPFGHVLVLNAQPGLTRIVATKDGRTFLDSEVVVAGGTQVTLATVRAID